jgi:hypothetical protein
MRKLYSQWVELGVSSVLPSWNEANAIFCIIFQQAQRYMYNICHYSLLLNCEIFHKKDIACISKLICCTIIFFLIFAVGLWVLRPLLAYCTSLG